MASQLRRIGKDVRITGKRRSLGDLNTGDTGLVALRSIMTGNEASYHLP
jgi:hypothetical protein